MTTVYEDLLAWIAEQPVGEWKPLSINDVASMLQVSRASAIAARKALMANPEVEWRRTLPNSVTEVRAKAPPALYRMEAATELRDLVLRAQRHGVQLWMRGVAVTVDEGACDLLEGRIELRGVS